MFFQIGEILVSLYFFSCQISKKKKKKTGFYSKFQQVAKNIETIISPTSFFFTFIISYHQIWLNVSWMITT